MGGSFSPARIPATATQSRSLPAPSQVLATLPLVACFLPLDALVSIMDGCLVAAAQTGYLSAIQIAGTGLQFLGLLYLGSQPHMTSTLSIWACLKLVTLFRLAGGCVRNLASSKSAYCLHRPDPGPLPGPG